MAKGPQTPPKEEPRVIDGEIVDSTERALASVNQGDLDATLAVALSEAEIDRQIATAHRFPRSFQKAIDNIKFLANHNEEMAHECIYSLPRGRDADGKPKAITGPSVRFMELVAQQFGNNRVAARVVTVDRKEKFVEAEGIYHDLETNSVVCARVRRRISGRDGRVYNEDMVIVTGNAAASIALRNAISRGVPKPIWGQAYNEVVEVVRGNAATVGQRRNELLKKFKEELDIKPAQVFAILGVKGVNDIGLDEIVVAAGFYGGLKRNEFTVEDLLRDVTPKSREGRSLSDANAGALPHAGGPVETPSDTVATLHGAETILPKETAEKLMVSAETGEIRQDPAESAGAQHIAMAQDNVRRRIAEESTETRSDPEDEKGAAEAEAEEQAQDGAAFDDWLRGIWETVGVLKTYGEMREAINSARKTARFAEASPEQRKMFNAGAYNLITGIQSEITTATEPSLYALWLDTSPTPEAIDAQWSSLVRSPAYRALNEAQKDALAAATHKAKGGDLL